MLPNVSILALLPSDSLAGELEKVLQGQRYSLTRCRTQAGFLEQVSQAGRSIDCLIIEGNAALPLLFSELHRRQVLLPTLIIAMSEATDVGALQNLYHPAKLSLQPKELEDLGDRIDSAIKQFLKLSPQEVRLDEPQPVIAAAAPSPAALLEQQQRLAHKLKERLGYLGVYYKRNPQNFYRNLEDEDRQELMADLTQKYQLILLTYFREDTEVNVLIDEFVNLAFFTDISVTQIVEIHMKLIDDYSKQLKLEGRNEEVLLNYRLTLLDIISHLCEMYRRSIPRES